MKKNNKPINQIMDAVHGLFIEFNQSSRLSSSRQSPRPDSTGLSFSQSTSPLMVEEFYPANLDGIPAFKRTALPPTLYVNHLEGIDEVDNAVDSNPIDGLDVALVDLNKVVKELVFDFCVHHVRHYEDYKNIQVMLAFLTSYADKLCIQKAKKIKDDGDGINFKTKIERLLHSKFNYFNNQTYLEFLVSCYIFHLLLEQVYLEYLKCTHDPVFDRLFANGFSLYLLMKKNIPPHLMKKLTYNFGYPFALDYKNDLTQIKQTHPFRFIRQIDDFMLNYNLWRLMIARFRRFYLNFQALFNYLCLNLFVSNVEPFLRRFMSWFNFLYFIPRVTTDVFNFFYHVFSFGNTFKSEHPLPLKVRFLMQVNRRWESFFRDMLWFVNSVLSLFVLVGPWGFLGLYVNAFMQFAETVLNVGLYFSFKNQQKDFLSSTNLLNIDMDESKKSEIFAEIQSRWDVDNRIRFIRMKNSVVILVSSLLIMPCMGAINLMIPFCGAVLGLVMTFVQFKSVYTFNHLRKTIKDPFVVEDIEHRLTSVVSSATLILA